MDQITQIYQRQVEILSGSVAFGSLVKISPNTLVDMSDPQFFQAIEQLSVSDTPRVVIGQSKFVPLPFGRASKTADFRQTFQYTLVAPDLRVELLNRLKFTTLAALTGAGDTWGMDGLIRDWSMEESKDVSAAGGTGALRWTSYMPITVNFYLPWTVFAAMGA